MASVQFEQLSDKDLTDLYACSIKEMKKRGIIRTGNVLGDLGEYLAIDYYNRHPNLPKLQPAPIGTQNVDAISRRGDRYSIKSTSSTTTGVFYGLNPPGSTEPDVKVFEFVIICKFNKDCSLVGIYQIDWDTFIKNKRWHARMSAWNLILSKKIIADSTVIFES